MQMNWQEEFEAALAAFGTVVEEPIEYRWHYNDLGQIYMCSMQNHPNNTQYLVVDRETYGDYNKYTVDIVKKKLIKIDFNPGVSVQLKRSSQGYAAVKDHAGILLEPGETYDSVEYYEPNY